MPDIIEVTIPSTIFDCLDYLAPPMAPAIAVGMRVWVPLRGKKTVGLVTGLKTLPQLDYPLKDIEAVIDEAPIVDFKLIALARWVATYYQSPLSEVMRALLPKKLRLGEPCQLPTQWFYKLNPATQTAIPANAKKQQALFDFLAKQPEPVSASIVTAQGYTSPTLKSLVDKCVITTIRCSLSLAPKPGARAAALSLNEQQQAAVATMATALGAFHAFLLFGITGSGKTEVYFQLMQQVLDKGQQILILVPEIGLTPQFVKRVEARFSCAVAVLHSGLSASERLNHWLWCSKGEARILIGTRSAIFTPLPQLGLIIVDEEHDVSFKQQEGVRFSARDIALKRAHALAIPIILGSATPSLESLHNALCQKYQLLRLTSRAVTDDKVLYRLIDLRNQRLVEGLTSATLERIKAHLARKQQVLVFINRRGFAPIYICHGCGWMADCKHCSAHLTVHYQQRKMICHHCGYQCALARHCQNCSSQEMIAVGAGTERISQYLQTVLPTARVERIDRDTISKKNALQAKLEAIDNGQVDILVGTQLLAKGHHFKRLTLVVMVDADAGLYSQDFRALERLGQMVTQVAGRSGREGGGEVLIQTHQVDNPHLNLLIQKGYFAFSQQLLQERQMLHWPPFTFLALLRAKAKKSEKVYAFFDFIKSTMSQLAPTLTILGPAPAPMEKKAGLFQLQLLVRGHTRGALAAALSQLRHQLRDKKNQRLIAQLHFSIDVDPQDLA